MNIPLVVLVVVITFLVGVILWLTFHYKNQITCMVGMMIAMVLGMTIGLLGGVILGIYFQGNLFISTMISMWGGLLIGFIAGSPISIIAILDGLLSGLMGGMMGAMLGDMVPIFYQDRVVKLLFVIAIGILFILIYMMVEEIGQLKERGIARLYQNPMIILMILILFFYGFNQLGPIFSDNIGPNESENINHH